MTIDLATPPQTSSSVFCITIQAPIITSIMVSMSAPRIGRSSANSISAPRSAPAMIATMQGEKEIEAERRGDEIDGIGAEGVELAMGEIHDAHDAENQRQPDAEQGVGAAEHDGIDADAGGIRPRASHACGRGGRSAGASPG